MADKQLVPLARLGERPKGDNRRRAKTTQNFIGGARPHSGPKALKPTREERELVEAMSGYGVPHDNIAALVRDGISHDSLSKHFPNELKRGKAKANARVGRTLFQKAIGGDVTSMIWWTKTQMRWAETQKIQHTGNDGDPISIEIGVRDDLRNRILEAVNTEAESETD